jgi:hypothetical protein
MNQFFAIWKIFMPWNFASVRYEFLMLPQDVAHHIVCLGHLLYA